MLNIEKKLFNKWNNILTTTIKIKETQATKVDINELQEQREKRQTTNPL